MLTAVTLDKVKALRPSRHRYAVYPCLYRARIIRDERAGSLTEAQVPALEALALLGVEQCSMAERGRS